jgi:hypothetical protein
MSDRFKPQILKNFEKWQTELHKWNTKTMGQKWAGGRFKYDATNQLVDTRVQKPLSKAHLEIIRKNPKKLHEATAKFASRSAICRRLAIGFTVATAVLAALSIYTTIAEMMEYYKVDFAPIPKYIVDEANITTTETINGKKQTIMLKNQTAYYKVVTCNRTDGGGSDIEKKNNEILLDRADLNGDVGQQWLALYSVKYDKGLPILADSLKFKQGKGGAPDGYTTGIHMFGEEAAQNLTESEPKHLCYNDPKEGTYVFFKVDTSATAAGSLFSGGSLMIGVLIGLVVGGGLMWLLTFSSKKRKEKSAS